MYCSKCGELLSDDAVFCQKCGAQLKEDPSSEKDEVIVMKGLCNRVTNPLFVQNGNAILTNKRLIYLKHSIAKTIAIGALINLTEGSYDFDIPLANIRSIADGRQGVSKTIVIHTKDDMKYNFYFTNREEWKIALQNALK